MPTQVCSPSRKLSILAAFTLLLTLAAAATSRAQDDPPMQAGRITYASGTVSIQPAGIDDWGQAQLNLPLGPGDRIFTDSDGRAEIQIGDAYIRIAPNSDVSVVEDTPDSISIGVAQGSLHVHCHGLWPGQQLHVNTPSGTITFGQPGDARVDVLADQGAAIFTGYENYQTITGAGGLDVGFSGGESLELAGTNPVATQWLQPEAPDDLDNWSRQRDQQIYAAASWRYVSPDVPGGDELDAYGSWMPATPYGAVWFPSVAAGWAPYHYGRWVNHAPWGPVWVEDEPWGYAPFHYGRWVNLEGRWGWVPGPRAVHPVWSPALVVFAGGIQMGGVGVSAWFPLGPGEPYRPWYPCSPRYVDQVNITNMAEGPRVHVLTTYVGVNFGGLSFAYRQTGITAMRQADFAAGRPVRETNVVVNVNVIQHVTIIERPVVQVNERVIVERAPSRPVPVAVARPTLINERGMVVSARVGFHPQAAPVRPAPQVHVMPGRQMVAPPPNNNFGHQPPANGGQPGGGQLNSGQPGNNRPGYQPGGNNAHPEQPVTQQPPVQQPGQPNNNVHQTVVKPGDQQFHPAQPQQPEEPQPGMPTGQRIHKPGAQPEDQPQQQPQPEGPAGQRTHKPATQPEDQPQQQQPQPEGPTGQRMHKPATQPEEQPQQQQQPQREGPTGQRMHKPLVQPDEQPANNPPAHGNNNATPGNGSSQQPGAHPGDNQGNGNQHGGKPEDNKNDHKDDHKGDKPHDKDK